MLAQLDPDARKALAPLLEERLPRGELLLVLGRLPSDVAYRLLWWLGRWRLRALSRPELGRLVELARTRRKLQRQAASLRMARRLLALWHTGHVPIGAVLFLVALLHVAASLYYR